MARSCANWIRQCMKTFGWTAWEGLSSASYTGFRARPTGDLDELEIAPKDAGRPMLELGMQGGPRHKKYKIYLDHVSVALNTERRKLFPTTASSNRDPASGDPRDIPITYFSPACLVEGAIHPSTIVSPGQRPGALLGRRRR